MKPIDWSRPVTTRDGRPLRVLCTDRFGELPVVALTENGDIEVFDIDGRYVTHFETSNDAINTPIKKHGWVNVYPDSSLGALCATEERANFGALDGRVACVKIEWTES